MEGLKKALMAVCFLTSFVGCFAQTSKPSLFNTIGKGYSNRTVPFKGITQSEESLDDDMEENEMAVVSSDTLRRMIPMVSLPLKSIRVTSPFGMRKDPLNRKTKRMHNGLDLRAKYEEVFSMLPGIVTATSYSKNGGYYVSVNHGSCVCSYLHLSKIRVRVGTHVDAGQVIAISGNTGKRTTGPHLHISCRLGDEQGKYFDPMIILGFVSDQLLNYSLDNNL